MQSVAKTNEEGKMQGVGCDDLVVWPQLTPSEMAREVMRSACEGTDANLTWEELEMLQANGYIEKLTKVTPRRWSFEWTDKCAAVAAEVKRLKTERPDNSDSAGSSR